SLDRLTVQIQRPAGVATPALAQATLTASDGQSWTLGGAVGDSSLVFDSAISPGWPPGPVTVQIEVDFYAMDNMVSCQAPKCSLVQEPGICSHFVSGTGVPCSDLLISSTTTVFTIQL